MIVVTIRVHDVRVVEDGPHLMAVATLASGQVFATGKIHKGHGTEIQEDAIQEIVDWVRGNRPDWTIRTFPSEGVVQHA